MQFEIQRRQIAFACCACLAIGATGACSDLKTASYDGARTDVDGTEGTGGADGADGTGDGDRAPGTGATPGSDGSTTSGDGSTSRPPDGSAPLAFGALPSGYCCSHDDDCRGQLCADVGGQKMCLDPCSRASQCRHGSIAFTCDSPNSFTIGRCQPDPGFVCAPASDFKPGPKALGACCSATNDGNAGLECAGGLCTARDDGPFVCTNTCRTGTDCGPGFMCQEVIDRMQCIPANSTYTCQ